LVSSGASADSSGWKHSHRAPAGQRLPGRGASGRGGWLQVGELGLALLLSACIGLEREIRQKNAGLRTHTLVGLGAALFILVSKYGFSDVIETQRIVLDPSRMAAQIVSGIGFIGAGLIFVSPPSPRRPPRSATAVSTLRVRYLDGRGVLRRLLQAATSQGFTIDEVSTDTAARHRAGRSGPGTPDVAPLVEVMLQVHGKQPVNDLAAILSDMDDVDAVLVNDANAVGD